MTRKRHNRLKEKANRRFAEAVGSALFATKVRLMFLCWEIEKLPSSEQQTKLSIMAHDLVERIEAAKIPNTTGDWAMSPLASCDHDDCGLRLDSVEVTE